MKYLIKARLEVDGRVDRHDVIGAIFGQTEGLLGSQFNLEELQNKDKIGRVHVDIRYQGTKTVGTIQIPSNLDRVETAILAAMLEVVDRIGPYDARITVEEIKDLRAEKLKKIIDRSKEILKKMKAEEPDLKEIIRKVQGIEAKQPKIREYGPDKLPAGPDVDKSDTIIIVEGRADVANLLRYGYTNVIALEGAREKIPKTIIDLSKKKQAIAFVDGDRGGDLILKNLLTQAKIDYVARAPKGMEVEQLTGREIAEALASMQPAEEVKKKLLPEEKEEKKEKPEEERKPEERAVEEEQVQTMTIPKKVIDDIGRIKGTLEAIIYDKDWNEVERVKVRDLFNKIQEEEPGKIHAIVFDGIITQRLLDAAADKGVSLLIGARVGSKLQGRPGNIRFMTFTDLT
ncbi:MAG: DNA primase [Desulfurococcales archaeon]|nr:DNA primase [Desulfurococcales archaeon]